MCHSDKYGSDCCYFHFSFSFTLSMIASAVPTSPNAICTAKKAKNTPKIKYPSICSSTISASNRGLLSEY